MRDGPRRFTQDFSCPALLRCRLAPCSPFRVRGSHPLRPGFPAGSAMDRTARWRRSYNPARRIATAAVWAAARSLAATCAIILIFFSSGYLDVSVPQVCPRTKYAGDGLRPAGFPHSDIRGSQGICPSPRLFAACHVLRRLREPQASPMRPFFLSFVLQVRAPPRHARGLTRWADARRARLLDLDRCRSISLSTRFLSL